MAENFAVLFLGMSKHRRVATPNFQSCCQFNLEVSVLVITICLTEMWLFGRESLHSSNRKYGEKD